LRITFTNLTLHLSVVGQSRNFHGSEVNVTCTSSAFVVLLMPPLPRVTEMLDVKPIFLIQYNININHSLIMWFYNDYMIITLGMTAQIRWTSIATPFAKKLLTRSRIGLKLVSNQTLSSCLPTIGLLIMAILM
jgi:hypothetical protein